MRSPSVSIILCTRNRAQSLRQTLGAMQGLHIPPGAAAELIVVDNASTDGTEAVVHDCRLPCLAVRYLRQERPGLSRSRNAGVAMASGDILLFTDDDVRPPRDWIGGMIRPILAGAAEAVAGGVTIAPHLMRPWMSLYLRAVLAATESLDPARPQRLVGANMAIARRVFSTIPEFDAELGAGAMGFGEETLFSLQLAAAGFRIAGALDVSVEHHFDPARLMRRALLDAAIRGGRSDAYVAWHWAHESSEPCDRSLISMKRDAKMWLRLLRHRFRSRGVDRNATPICDWEIQQVRALAFRRQFRVEMRRPRNYPRHGFRKHSIHSAVAASAASAASAVSPQELASHVL